jgi:N6-adenosine-specific RNA methylase IME4
MSTAITLGELTTCAVKFGCIYVDPPWLYGNQATRAATSNHYAGMTATQLRDLPVKELAADDAHLHLWTTNGFLREALALVEFWGFEFKSSFVWIKPHIGLGNYWGIRTKFC